MQIGNYLTIFERIVLLKKIVGLWGVILTCLSPRNNELNYLSPRNANPALMGFLCSGSIEQGCNAIIVIHRSPIHVCVNTCMIILYICVPNPADKQT